MIMRISKNSVSSFLTICVLGLIIIISAGYFMNKTTDYQVSPSLSEEFLENSSPIYIDGLDPNNNWETFAANNPSIIGMGEPGNAYMIYGLLIDAKGGSSCITIKNSNVLFQIDNSVFFNTSQGDNSAGIYLENVSYGFILNSDFYDHGSNGITLINSRYLTIWGNSFHNNRGTGIYFSGTSSCTILENIINEHEGNGIELYNNQEIAIYENNISVSGHSAFQLTKTTNSIIINNIISHSYNGITLEDSRHNTITYNNISHIDENGIILQENSRYNTISYNKISYAFYCISIGSSSYGTHLKNNEASLIRTFKEVSIPPSPLPQTNGDSGNLLPLLGYFVVVVAFCVVIIRKSNKYSIC